MVFQQPLVGLDLASQSINYSKRIRVLLLTKRSLQKKLDRPFDQWVLPKRQGMMVTSLKTPDTL